MLLERYSHKIKTVKELTDLLGTRPRKKSVMLCHGVFDIVHPGHVHHLVYAKSKADTLVVAITADRFVDKGIYRPHVPQELRALNLAAFDAVDYVVVDDEPGPYKLLKDLEPDYYAKGFEYSEDGRNDGKTHSPAQVVEDYGGQVIYTPGDVVYSSTNILEAEPPDLRYEKLAVLMDRSRINFDDLRQVVRELSGAVAHVVGDSIVDVQTQCTMIGASGKTPTISALRTGSQRFIGGAAVVAAHMRAAGADVTFTSVAGDDEVAGWLLGELNELGITCNFEIDTSRPTTVKEVVVVDGYRIIKVDTVDNRTISDLVMDRLAAYISRTPFGVLVMSDFRHGIFNSRTIPALIDAIPRDRSILRVADSQVASRWGNILEFSGFDLITPNEKEARFVLGDQDSGVRPLASALYEQANCKTLLMKMGERGVLACTNGDREATNAFVTLDSFVDNLIDPVGAGDALLAYASLALRMRGSPAIATILGTFAAAAECEQEGNIPIAPQYVLDKIDQVEERLR